MVSLLNIAINCSALVKNPSASSKPGQSASRGEKTGGRNDAKQFEANPSLFADWLRFRKTSAFL